MSAPTSTPIGFNHSLWNKPITHIPAHNICTTAPSLLRGASPASSPLHQLPPQPHPSDCYRRGGVQRPSMSAIPTPQSTAPNSTHHTPTHSLSITLAAPTSSSSSARGQPASSSAAATVAAGCLVPPPPPARLSQPSGAALATSYSAHLTPTLPAALSPPPPQPAAAAVPAPSRAVVTRRVAVPGWTIEREQYIAMEPREVTVMRERTVPAIQHTAHTEWRPVERRRLEPIPARRPAEEEKEQMTPSAPTHVSGAQRQSDAEDELHGVLVPELDVRVDAVRGRHGSNGALLVCDVLQRGVGSRAGLLIGDVLTAVDSSEAGSAKELQARLQGSKGSVSLRVLRDGRRHLTLIANVQR